ncbi:uncharacterized protein [Miscanthus floridulus]|uniref:uncharacterized protein n=1 Tax=Miscanthus floridulus TaxID=154761 RepID=UPI00345757CA
MERRRCGRSEDSDTAGERGESVEEAEGGGWMDEQEAEEGIYRVWEGERETGVEETEDHVVDSGRREKGGGRPGERARAQQTTAQQHCCSFDYISTCDVALRPPPAAATALAPRLPPAATAVLAPRPPYSTLAPDPPPRRPRPRHPPANPRRRAVGLAAPRRGRPSPPWSATGHRIRGAPAAPGAGTPCPPSPALAPPAPPRSASGHRFRAASCSVPHSGAPAVPRLPGAGPRQRPRRARRRPGGRGEEQDLSEGTRSTSATLIVFVGVAAELQQLRAQQEAQDAEWAEREAERQRLQAVEAQQEADIEAGVEPGRRVTGIASRAIRIRTVAGIARWGTVAVSRLWSSFYVSNL